MNITTHIAIKSPTNEALLAYWRKQAGEITMPSRGDIDPFTDLRDIIGHLFLVDVEPKPLRFRFRLVGTEVVEHVGKDMTGKYLDELVEFDKQYESVMPDYEGVVESHREVTRPVRFMTKDGERYLNYERLLLPLSEDGKTVNMILGACSPLDEV